MEFFSPDEHPCNGLIETLDAWAKEGNVVESRILLLSSGRTLEIIGINMVKHAAEIETTVSLRAVREK